MSAVLSNIKQREVVASAAVVFSMAMLMRIRRKRKNKKKSAAAASLAERFAFPISVDKETREVLGIDLGEVSFMPPRLSAVSVLGLPDDSSNPVQNVCLVVDALTRPVATSSAGNDIVSETDLVSFLFSENVVRDEAALTSAVRAYVSDHCNFLTGSMLKEELDAVTCQRVKDTSATVSLEATATSTAPLASSKPQAAPQSKRVSSALTAPNSAAIPFEFGFEVKGSDLHAFVALVPEAELVIILVVVEREAAKNSNNSTQQNTFVSLAAPGGSQTMSSKEMSDVRDSLDIGLMLRRALTLKRAAIERLITKRKDGATSTQLTVTNTNISGSASPSGSPAVDTATNNVVISHSHMKVRAVLPANLTATVEDVRCPSVVGGSELFITLTRAEKEKESEEKEEELASLPPNFCRVTYHPTMPSTWEDEKAITDASEKEDEFKRNAMRHFLGYVSNSITFHTVDIGGRNCLWFGEEAEGFCCRTYICPSFDISGQKIAKKQQKGTANSSNEKGMIVIRWEGPKAGWERSQRVLSSFLDYFQFN